MKITQLKIKLGMNIIAIIGWIALMLFFYMVLVNFPAIGIGIYTFCEIILIGISLLICIVEQIFKHEIKNPFILNNKIYNVFFIIGLSLSAILILFFVKIITIGF